MNSLKEVIHAPGEGKSLWVLGDLYTFKVTGDDTNGKLVVIEQVIQPENGPPPHVHHREDEVFHVLEGSFSFLCGERKIEAAAGTFVHVPKGTLHTFRNKDQKPGRLMVIISPAGLEHFFREIGTPALGKPSPPSFDPAIVEKVMRLAPEYHMEIKVPEPG